jgi:hypothetical protein
MFQTTYVTNISNETREIINDGINVAIAEINNFINENNLNFKNLKKINYKENIENGNNYFFLYILEKKIIIEVLYNFCSEKETLEKIYFNFKGEINEFLNMNFGIFLLKKGFPFSDEYKNKHSNIIIENNLFPYTPIRLDKLNYKQNSIEKIKFKDFPFNKNNNFTENPTNNSTNIDNIIFIENLQNEKNEKKSFVNFFEEYYVNYKNIIENNDNQIFENNNNKSEYSNMYNDENSIYSLSKDDDYLINYIFKI